MVSRCDVAWHRDITGWYITWHRMTNLPRSTHQKLQKSPFQNSYPEAWPWLLSSSRILSRSILIPNFGTVRWLVQQWECWLIDRHTDTPILYPRSLNQEMIYQVIALLNFQNVIAQNIKSRHFTIVTLSAFKFITSRTNQWTSRWMSGHLKINVHIWALCTKYQNTLYRANWL